MEERVSISISEGVADVRLVRADKMNALDQAMFEALVAATDRLSRDKSVRAVVLSGEGRAFCAGEHDGAHAFFLRKTLGCRDKGLEHGLIERIHLVRPHQAHVGDAFRNRNRDALFHG